VKFLQFCFMIQLLTTSNYYLNIWIFKYILYDPPLLTPKIPCIFFTKLCNFWHSWKNHYFKKLKYLEVTLLEINLKKLQLFIPWEVGYYNIQTSKFCFFWMFFTVNFFTPKLMKIRWSFPFFWIFCTSLPNQVEYTWLKS
jgi:hypothetical protein